MLLPPLALALICSGCARLPIEEDVAFQHEETYYFDAELSFSIEYPSDWHLVRGNGSEPGSCTVRWHSGTAPGEAAPAATATALACPITLWSGEFPKMIADFKMAHPAMIIKEEGEIDLPGGKGFMVSGKEEETENLAVFLRSESRGYVLTFSAAGTSFEVYRPVFQEMIESFRPLGEPLLFSSPKLRDHPDEPSPSD